MKALLKSYVESEQKKNLEALNFLSELILPYEYSLEKLKESGITFTFKKNPETCIMREIVIKKTDKCILKNCTLQLEAFIKASCDLLAEYNALKIEKQIRDNLIFIFVQERRDLAVELYFQTLR